MVGEFEAKLVSIYIEENYPGSHWVFYVIKDDIMTISYRDEFFELCEVTVTFNELIDTCKYGTS
jgi:hypothetical protein